MSAGDVAIDDMVRSLRALERLPEDAAARAAPLVEAAAKKLAAAGVSPEGKAWSPRKADGGRALANAADHLSAKAVGTKVVLQLKGPEVIHNFGTTRIPARPILPELGAGVPKAFADALLEGASQAFDRATGGGR